MGKKMSSGENEDVTLKYLEISWENIQHNERLRNNFFNLYLVISGVFLFFFGKTVAGMAMKQVIFVAALFVWAVGLTFLWSYVRLRHMISRDAKIIRIINELLHNNNQLESPIWSEYEQFYKILKSKSVLRLGSVGRCVTVSTTLISAMTISIGVWQMTSMNYYYLFLLILLFFILNQLILMGFGKMWG